MSGLCCFRSSCDENEGDNVYGRIDTTDRVYDGTRHRRNDAPIDNRDYVPGLETERRAHSYVDTLRVRRSVRICEPFLDP